MAGSSLSDISAACLMSDKMDEVEEIDLNFMLNSILTQKITKRTKKKKSECVGSSKTMAFIQELQKDSIPINSLSMVNNACNVVSNKHTKQKKNPKINTIIETISSDDDIIESEAKTLNLSQNKQPSNLGVINTSKYDRKLEAEKLNSMSVLSDDGFQNKKDITKHRNKRDCSDVIDDKHNSSKEDVNELSIMLDNILISSKKVKKRKNKSKIVTLDLSDCEEHESNSSLSSVMSSTSSCISSVSDKSTLSSSFDSNDQECSSLLADILSDKKRKQSRRIKCKQKSKVKMPSVLETVLSEEEEDTHKYNHRNSINGKGDNCFETSQSEAESRKDLDIDDMDAVSNKENIHRITNSKKTVEIKACTNLCGAFKDNNDSDSYVHSKSISSSIASNCSLAYMAEDSYYKLNKDTNDTVKNGLAEMTLSTFIMDSGSEQDSGEERCMIINRTNNSPSLVSDTSNIATNDISIQASVQSNTSSVISQTVSTSSEKSYTSLKDVSMQVSVQSDSSPLNMHNDNKIDQCRIKLTSCMVNSRDSSKLNLNSPILNILQSETCDKSLDNTFLDFESKGNNKTVKCVVSPINSILFDTSDHDTSESKSFSSIENSMMYRTALDGFLENDTMKSKSNIYSVQSCLESARMSPHVTKRKDDQMNENSNTKLNTKPKLNNSNKDDHHVFEQRNKSPVLNESSSDEDFESFLNTMKQPVRKNLATDSASNKDDHHVFEQRNKSPVLNESSSDDDFESFLNTMKQPVRQNLATDSASTDSFIVSDNDSDLESIEEDNAFYVTATREILHSNRKDLSLTSSSKNNSKDLLLTSSSEDNSKDLLLTCSSDDEFLEAKSSISSKAIPKKKKVPTATLR